VSINQIKTWLMLDWDFAQSILVLLETSEHFQDWRPESSAGSEAHRLGSAMI
jgi:hypothetical protein